MEQQRAKEAACLFALRRGFSLFSRGHLVYGVYPDGHVFPVCGSRNVVELWSKAARVLAQEEAQFRAKGPTFRLHTPSGVFEAHTWRGLLWNWLTGRRPEAPTCDEG